MTASPDLANRPPPPSSPLRDFRRFNGFAAPSTSSYRSHLSALVVAVLILVTASWNVAAVGASTDFYYDHWRCNNYLSGETVVVGAAAGRLIELHIRNNIAVSQCLSTCVCRVINSSCLPANGVALALELRMLLSFIQRNDIKTIIST